MDDWKNKPDSFWKEKLSPLEFEVCRQKGTERPYTGKYTEHDEEGHYECICCGLALFGSKHKFNSCGWPSYWAPLDPAAVEYHQDLTHGMKRVEVTCARCGGHLGHIFDDGPPPSHKRYCINSVSLKFVPLKS